MPFSTLSSTLFLFICLTKPTFYLTSKFWLCTLALNNKKMLSMTNFSLSSSLSFSLRVSAFWPCTFFWSSSSLIFSHGLTLLSLITMLEEAFLCRQCSSHELNKGFLCWNLTMPVHVNPTLTPWLTSVCTKVQVFSWLFAHEKLNTCDLLRKKQDHGYSVWFVILKCELFSSLFLHWEMALKLWLFLFFYQMKLALHCLGIPQSSRYLLFWLKNIKVLGVFLEEEYCGCVIKSTFRVIWFYMGEYLKTDSKFLLPFRKK